MYLTSYVRRPLLLKEKPHLWYYSQELFRKNNDEQLGGLWDELYNNPPGMVLEAYLDVMIMSLGGESLR